MNAPETLRRATPGWSKPELPVLRHHGVVPVGDADAIEATPACTSGFGRDGPFLNPWRNR